MANKNVKYNDDGTADITLSKEFSLGGTKVKVLRMREPTVKDQTATKALSNDPEERERIMFGNLCGGIAPAEFESMPLRDYARIQEAFMGFLD
jgi:hypothetical protein